MKRTQKSSLANLRPETVLAVEGLSFADKVLALPGVQDVQYSISEVPFAKYPIDSDSVEDADHIDVASLLNMKPEHEEHMVVMDKFIVAGGLLHDDNVSNPMEDSCGNGSIYHYGRRGWRGEEANFFEAIGYDRYGNKDFEHDGVLKILGEMVWRKVHRDRAYQSVLYRILKRHGRDRYYTVEEAIKTAAERGGSISWIADTFTGEYSTSRLSSKDLQRLEPIENWMSELNEKAWQRARMEGLIGNPLAVMLDIYEHSGIMYSVHGEGQQCRWDTSRCSAVWVPCDDAEDTIRYKVLSRLCGGQVQWRTRAGETSSTHVSYTLDEGKTWHGEFKKWGNATAAMVKASGKVLHPSYLDEMLRAEAETYCRGVLDTYNDWCNGSCYGVVLYAIDRQTGEVIDNMDDECWGFIGDDASRSLEESILNMVIRLGRPLH